MEIFTSDKYKYWFVDDNIIMFQKKSEIKEINNDVLTIASNTVNTWQEDRQDKELINNTVQGKLAEDMFTDLISFMQTEGKITYLSYDDFRNDSLKKHAPIDGLLYESDNPNIDNGIDKILKDVESNDYGGISISTRAYLSQNKLYTVEIKSSRIPDKDYEGIDLENFQKQNQQQVLIETLRKRDYLTYPRYTRSLGQKVHDFNQYCEYVKINRTEFSGIDGEDLKSAIIAREIETKCDIYTRIFMDWDNTESLVGYLTGYALKTDFFESPRVINMYRKGKSENALYYVYPISKTKNLPSIFADKRLWG